MYCMRIGKSRNTQANVYTNMCSHSLLRYKASYTALHVHMCVHIVYNLQTYRKWRTENTPHAPETAFNGKYPYECPNVLNAQKVLKMWQKVSLSPRTGAHYSKERDNKACTGSGCMSTAYQAPPVIQRFHINQSSDWCMGHAHMHPLGTGDSSPSTNRNKVCCRVNTLFSRAEMTKPQYYIVRMYMYLYSNRCIVCTQYW